MEPFPSSATLEVAVLVPQLATDAVTLTLVYSAVSLLVGHGLVTQLPRPVL